MESLIQAALDARSELFRSLHAEGTDTCRLFHGANEGLPGITIDRYGDRILVQSFHDPLLSDVRNRISQYLSAHLDFSPRFDFKDRSPASGKASAADQSPEQQQPSFSAELGLKYLVKDNQHGQDPYLFLDMRAGRRFILKHSRHLSVLNLFAYTCSLGLSAAAGGADEVWNIDFARSALDVGRINLAENGFSDASHYMIQADFFPAVRQLAGLPVKGRGRKKRYRKFSHRQFDLVLLDPPRWATSSFGAVDLVRDYQSVFKPALLVTRPGGRLICTNHVPTVQLDDWLDILKRCARKAGIAIEISEIITPESDFPSPDGQHPLKITVIERT